MLSSTSLAMPDTLTPLIAHLTAACPLQAGPLRTAISDLALAVEWRELRPLQLPGTQWAVVVGHKRAEVGSPVVDIR